MKAIRGQNHVQIRNLSCFLSISVIIILSGCVSPCAEPKSPLDEVMLRVADSQTEENVIHFIEFHDFRTFLGMNETDQSILSEYDDSFTHAKFMQKISLILFNSRKDYVDRENLLTGDLFSYIACRNVSNSNNTQFNNALIDMVNYQNYSRQLDIVYASNIVAYIHLNSTLVIVKEDDNAIHNFIELISINTEFDWYWVALVAIKYEWTCCSTNGPGCYSGHLHGEIIVLSPTLQPLGVLATYELHVA